MLWRVFIDISIGNGRDMLAASCLFGVCARVWCCAGADAGMFGLGFHCGLCPGVFVLRGV